jgi:kanamycin kinase
MDKNEAFAYFEIHRSFLETNTLLHGDFCLPNILLDDWKFSGFIDLGNGGVGDRHVDLFWGAWTLAFNLGTDAYRDRFFDAYGRDRIDLDLVNLVGVAECFG